MKRVNIVIDNPSSWFVRKVDNLIKKIKSFGFDCELLSGSEFIPENSYITFFLSCEKFINQKARDKSEFNIVIHASDLPKGRGMSPATWQILEGKNRIWITLFEVTDKIDAGDYYFKKSFLLNGTELIDEWQEKIYQCIEKITLEFIKKHQRLKPIKQRGKPTFYKRRRPQDSELDMDGSLKDQFNLLRVVDNDNYPAFFRYRNKKYILKIFKAD